MSGQTERHQGTKSTMPTISTTGVITLDGSQVDGGQPIAESGYKKGQHPRMGRITAPLHWLTPATDAKNTGYLKRRAEGRKEGKTMVHEVTTGVRWTWSPLAQEETPHGESLLVVVLVTPQ